MLFYSKSPNSKVKLNVLKLRIPLFLQKKTEGELENEVIKNAYRR